MLVATAMLWSLGGVLIKTVEWHPLAIAASRASIAALVIYLYVVFIEKRKLQFKRDFNQVGGALCYAATVTLYVTANKLTTNANAIVLQYTAPVYVALFGAWFLGERVRRDDVVTTVIVMSGITLFFFDKLSADNIIGIVVALLSGVSMGWMVLFIRRQKDTSSLESMLIGNLITTCIGIPFIIAAPLPNAEGLSYIALLGIVQIGIPYILYSRAMKYATALEGVLLTMLEPVLSPLWVMLALNETPGTMSFFGGVIVIGSVAIRAIFGWKKE
jgi:drug/metabolite transporter (DMT)-like permease